MSACSVCMTKSIFNFEAGLYLHRLNYSDSYIRSYVSNTLIKYKKYYDIFFRPSAPSLAFMFNYRLGSTIFNTKLRILSNFKQINLRILFDHF